MFFASIETDLGEVYRLARPDGFTGGRPLLFLITPLSVHCGNGDKEFHTDQWMNSLSEMERQELCRNVHILESNIFSMERDYSFIDYEYFNTKIAPGQLSKETYQAIIEHANLSWTPIAVLVITVETIENALLHSPPHHCYWYEIGETDGDLVGLKEALLLGKSRGAKRGKDKHRVINFLALNVLRFCTSLIST